MECIYTTRAEDDLEAIGDRIADDSPTRAVSFIAELRARCAKIGQSPNAFMVVDELDGLAVRKARFGSYRIYYVWLDAEDAVAILHIRHDARLEPKFST